MPPNHSSKSCTSGDQQHLESDIFPSFTQCAWFPIPALLLRFQCSVVVLILFWLCPSNLVSASDKSAQTWFVSGDLRGNYALMSGKDPTVAGRTEETLEDEQAMIYGLDAGLFPFLMPGVDIALKYGYRQDWLTDADRVKTYREDTSDFDYQPFRTDRMERTHSLTLTLETSLNRRFSCGWWHESALYRVGASEFYGPELTETYRVLTSGYEYINVPWVRYHWSQTTSTQLHLYLTKTIDLLTPEHSNRSYTAHGRQTRLSYGLSHDTPLMPERVTLHLDFVYYNFVYNDYWSDYSRSGGGGALNFKAGPAVEIRARAARYRDHYAIPTVKTGSCKGVRQGSGTPVECERNEMNLELKLDAVWTFSDHGHVGAGFGYASADNNGLREYDKSRQVVTVFTTLAFPDVGVRARFSPFSDIVAAARVADYEYR